MRVELNHLAIVLVALTAAQAASAEPSVGLRARDAANLLVDPAALRQQLEKGSEDPAAQAELAQLLTDGQLDGLRQAQLESLLANGRLNPQAAKLTRDRLQSVRSAETRDLNELRAIYVAMRAWCADRKPSDLPLLEGLGWGTRYSQVPAEYVATDPDRHLAALIVKNCPLQRLEDSRSADVMDLLARWYAPAMAADPFSQPGYQGWAEKLRDPDRPIDDFKELVLLGKQIAFATNHASNLLKGYQPITEAPRGKKKPVALELGRDARRVLATASQQLSVRDGQGALATLDAGTGSLTNPLEQAQAELVRGRALQMLKRPADAAAAYRRSLGFGTLDVPTQTAVFVAALRAHSEAIDRPGFEALVMEHATKAGIAERIRL